MAEPREKPVETRPFTLRDFYVAARERFPFEIVVPGDLDRRVPEPMLYRPGLALTGFFGNFAWRRLQVIGIAEQAYLKSLSPDERRARIRALFDAKVYCVICAAGRQPAAEMRDLAAERGVTLFVTGLLTRDFFHQCTFVLENLRAPRAKMYGTTLEVGGLGVMLEGEPGLGKSETALGLIRNGAALIADDLTCVRKDVAADAVYASASPATRDYMEIRGLGIIDVPKIFGVNAVSGEKRLDLVVLLKPLKGAGDDFDRGDDNLLSRDVLGVAVPQIVLPVSEGRDLVNLVETAVQQFKLRRAGFRASVELDARLKKRANGLQEGE